jgi:hypothetical protein
LLDQLTELIQKLPEDEKPGHVNYFVTVLLKRITKPEKYFRYNWAIGVLEAIKLELYRRQIAFYEDKKSSENGDV